MLIGSLRAAAVTMDAQTVAAPPISALIASMEGDGFREIPPLPRRSENDFNESFRNIVSCELMGLRASYHGSPVKGDALAH